jgi:hypothetical protein
MLERNGTSEKKSHMAGKAVSSADNDNDDVEN